MVVVAGCCSAFSCVLCQDSDFSVEKKRKTETCHEAMHCPSQFLETASASKVSSPWLVQDFPLVPQTVDTTVSQASKLFFFFPCTVLGTKRKRVRTVVVYAGF